MSSLLHGCHTCGACSGNGCDACGGTGAACGRGCGLFHRGDSCGACGGNGCGFCRGLGLLRKGCGDPCGPGGLRGDLGCGGSLTSLQSPAPIPRIQALPQSAFVPGQCGDRGCLLRTRHFHRIGRGCSACGGNGCGICQGSSMPCGNVCGNCRGGGCGLCGGRGLFHGDDSCNSRLGALTSLPHTILAKLLHKGEIQYFVGPGGPVPLTPGYVPYIVTTRAPQTSWPSRPSSISTPDEPPGLHLLAGRWGPGPSARARDGDTLAGFFSRSPRNHAPFQDRFSFS